MISLRGYTLVELLVGLTVILAVGSIVFAIFVAGLRGANKSTSIEAIRQNGSSALNQITRAVRNAKTFNGVSLGGVSSFTASCVMPNGPTPPFTQYSAVSVTSFEDATDVYRCPSENETAVFKNNSPLTDESVSVVPGSCYFTCVQTGVASAPSVGINFTLQNQVQTGSADIDSEATFTTTVSPRNFTR